MPAPIVLITGCSQGGIGSALCRKFASEGCKVYATSRRLQTMETLTHTNIDRLCMDVGDDASVKNTVEHIVQREGRIDILVNNAGVMSKGPVIDLEMAKIQQMFDTNVFGVIRTCRAVIPHMAARKSGSIINVGSLASGFPTPFNGVYSASKAALESITDALYMECKPFDISVTYVFSGGARTTSTQQPWQPPAETVYKDYVDLICTQSGRRKDDQGGTPLEEYASAFVAKTLLPSPPRRVLVGAGAKLVTVLQWLLPRRFLYWLLWSQMVEKPRMQLSKQK
ncbi:oxidoreductase [Daedaleopsis nitida]|nr:oxidoreductase [Daedaleopsis nitida]